MEEKKEILGKIIETLSNGTFRIITNDNEILFGYLSGKMKKNHIKITKGDKIKIKVSKYDKGKGIITFRM